MKADHEGGVWRLEGVVEVDEEGVVEARHDVDLNAQVHRPPGVLCWGRGWVGYVRVRARKGWS
jgi:hypothetical protein